MDASTRGKLSSDGVFPIREDICAGRGRRPSFYLVYFLIVYAHYYIGKRVFVNDVFNIVVFAEHDLAGYILNIARNVHIYRFARKIQDIADGEIGYNIVLHGVLDLQHLGVILTHYRQHL